MINIKNWIVMKLGAVINYSGVLIPTGMYCYTLVEEPSIFNNFTPLKKKCPYYLKISNHSYGCRVTGEIETWGTALRNECKVCGIKDE